jgi:hypothetical protein
MATICKKTWKNLFEKVLSGEKKFDVRIADFEIKKGDTLVLEEWDEDKKEYTGRKIETTATFILKTKDQEFWSKEDVEKYGFQVIQFEKKNK